MGRLVRINEVSRVPSSDLSYIEQGRCLVVVHCNGLEVSR